MRPRGQAPVHGWITPAGTHRRPGFVPATGGSCDKTGCRTLGGVFSLDILRNIATFKDVDIG